MFYRPTHLQLAQTCAVFNDGKIVGWTTHEQGRIVADTLRYWKVNGGHGLPLDLEIGYVPPSNKGQYPGLYILVATLE